MLNAILRMTLSLFGDKLANAFRFEGYAYLMRKHGREAFTGIPGETPGWILPEDAGLWNDLTAMGVEDDEAESLIEWEAMQ